MSSCIRDLSSMALVAKASCIRTTGFGPESRLEELSLEVFA